MRISKAFPIIWLFFSGFLGSTLVAVPAVDGEEMRMVGAGFVMHDDPQYVLAITKLKDSPPQVTAGYFVAISESAAAADGGIRRYEAGAMIPARLAESAESISIVVMSAGGELAVSSHRAVTATAGGIEEAVDRLREELLKSREQLRSWELQVDEQERSIARLRADAGVVANLGKILEIEGRAAEAKQHLEALQRDIELLQQFTQRSARLTEPVNYSLRLNQLTRSVAELAEEAKRAEVGEIRRRAEGEEIVRERLRLIERTRAYDIDVLTAELERLRGAASSSSAQ